VIPVYNESETLLTLIDRVLKAEIPLEKELILVDDYSTDGTRDLYPTLSEKFPALISRSSCTMSTRAKVRPCGWASPRSQATWP
jgi:GT2 family glycosyltransferase